MAPNCAAPHCGNRAPISRGCATRHGLPMETNDTSSTGTRRRLVMSRVWRHPSRNHLLPLCFVTRPPNPHLPLISLTHSSLILSLSLSPSRSLALSLPLATRHFPGTIMRQSARVAGVAQRDSCGAPRLPNRTITVVARYLAPSIKHDAWCFITQHRFVSRASSAARPTQVLPSSCIFAAFTQCLMDAIRV